MLLSVSCSINYDDIFARCCILYGYLCHVLDWWCCFVELNCCAFLCKVILLNTFRHDYKFFFDKSCHHQYSLTVSLQMSRGTRDAKQRANMNPPPPPPPPNPVELMQMMVENQRLLTETINQMANQGGRNAPSGPAPNQYSSFKDFVEGISKGYPNWCT